MQNVFNIPASFLEKLHPLTKLLFLLFVIVATIFFDHLIPVVFIGCVVTVWILLGNQLKKLSLFLLFFLAVALVVISALYLFTGGGINTELSIISFIKMFSHIFCGLSVALSTSPRKTAAFLHAIKAPKHFLFVFILTLRFLPVMIAEYRAIKNALKLRGQKIMGLLFFRPGLIIFPVVVRASKLSDELALSAETRGFNVQEIKLPAEPVGISYRDILVYFGILVILILLILQEKGLLV
ncbi:MAG: energy-coupling factor transporter transmembrane component T family protein [Bacteroidota bacterium]